ncbi:type IV pilus assembly protein PilO [Candidatus Magnetomoraceae bacterium gMMP-15]
MQFFHNIVEKISQLTKVQRILICAGSLFLVVGGFVYFAYMIKFDEISRLNEDKEQLESDLYKAKIKAGSLKRYQKELNEVEKKFELVKKVIPDKEEISSLLESISRSGSETGLEFTLFKPGSEIPMDFYVEIPVSINIIGTYHNLGVFFDKVSRLSRVVNIKNLKIVSVSSNKKKNQTLLNVSCKAVTYKFLEKKN